MAGKRAEAATEAPAEPTPDTHVLGPSGPEPMPTGRWQAQTTPTGRLARQDGFLIRG